jgi:alanine racemase
MTTFVAVNTDALAHNVREAQRLLQPTAKLMAVVKANAYGHGLVETARVFVAAGAAWLGVSTVAEGVALREAGLDAPVLVFMPPLPDEFEPLVRHRLTGTVLSTAEVSGLGQTAQKLGLSAYAHTYSDGGLGRIGADETLADLLGAATVFPSLHLTGAYTHFGPPGSGRILEEIDTLREGASTKAFAGLARDTAAQSGAARPLLHVAASALFLEDPASHLDMVRLGTLLYGQYPDHVRKRPLSLREDTFSLRSRIVAVHTLLPGSRVGYGGEFICRRETRVATVPVGTSQGLGMAPQSASGRLRPVVKAWLVGREGRKGRSQHAPRAQVNGTPVQLLGRISMDQCCLDVTDVPAAQIGAEVALPVRRLAVDSGVPRMYVKDEG